MKLNIQKTIKLFDEKIPENGGHISGIIGLFGEELLIQIFAHYLKAIEYEVSIYNEIPKTGNLKGSRLDAWIECKKGNQRFLYQTEVKNWSAYAVGGKSVPLNIDEKKLRKQSRDRHDQQFNEHFQKSQKTIVNKVLIPMMPPKNANVKIAKPVVIYWWPISQDGTNPFMRFRPNKKLLKKLKSPSNFRQVFVFSASLYLRSLHKKEIKYLSLDLSKTEKRQALIRKILLS